MGIDKVNPASASHPRPGSPFSQTPVPQWGGERGLAGRGSLAHIRDFRGFKDPFATGVFQSTRLFSWDTITLGLQKPGTR